MMLMLLAAFVYVGCSDDGGVGNGNGNGGGNTGGKDTCCKHSGTVVYLPEGCIVPPGGGRIGIVDEAGNFYYVADDQTGEFKNLKVGDKIKFGFDKKDTCYVNFSNSGIWAPPISCITLRCIDVVGSGTSSCAGTKSLTYDAYRKAGMHFYNVDDYELTNSMELKLDVWFSGCDPDVMVDLVVTELPSAGIVPYYVAKLEYTETMCAMVVNKDLCYDLSDLPANARLDLQTAKGGIQILGK